MFYSFELIFIFKVYLNLKYTCYMSYPNFFRIPLFVGMRPPFDYFKMFNIHCHGIRKVLGRFGKKNSQKHNSRGGELIKHRGALRKLHSRRGGLINYGMRSGIFLKKPLGRNHLHFVKK